MFVEQLGASEQRVVLGVLAMPGLAVPALPHEALSPFFALLHGLARPHEVFIARSNLQHGNSRATCVLGILCATRPASWHRRSGGQTACAMSA